jgi:hypothetical protein
VHVAGEPGLDNFGAEARDVAVLVGGGFVVLY